MAVDQINYELNDVAKLEPAEMFGRYFRLYVCTDTTNSQAIDLSEFSVDFRITQSTISRDCMADIMVYNLGRGLMRSLPNPNIDTLKLNVNRQATANTVFPRVIIEAGYEKQHSQVFIGSLLYRTLGRRTPTETFVRMLASTGGFVQRYSLVSHSFARGASQKEVLTVVENSFTGYRSSSSGVKKFPLTPALSATRYLRGKVVFDTSSGALDKVAKANSFDWTMGTGGELVAVGEQNLDTTQVVVLTPATGLLGRPVITVDGLRVKALLNPMLQVGTIIQIDPTTVQRDMVQISNNGAEYQGHNLAVGGAYEDIKGYYQVISREIHGQTRGNDWSVDMLCIAINSAIPLPISSTDNVRDN